MAQPLRLPFLTLLAALALASPVHIAAADSIPGRMQDQAPAAAAPQAAAEEPPLFGESIDVRVVNLEVVVTDSWGNRVRGLTPQDFRLLVDGKPVAIDYFTEVAGGRAVREDEPAAGTPVAPAVTTPPVVAGVEPGSEVGTSYVVFVDRLFSYLPAKRNYVLQGILDGLDWLGPADRVAVVGFDGERPHLLGSWSGERAAIQEAVEAAMGLPGKGAAIEGEQALHQETQRFNAEVARRTARRGGIDPLDNPGFGCDFRPSLYGQLHRVVSGVTATLRGLADAPGRKVMLIVSDGWPTFIPGPESLSYCKPADLDPFAAIPETANLLGFTVYPVVVKEPPPAIDPEDKEPVDPFADALVEFSRLQETAHRLAFETGGTPLVAGARTAALAKVAEDTRAYYWLGFTPAWKKDDRAHRVEIEVRRPGRFSVRSRNSFRDLSRDTELALHAESRLLFGAAPAAAELPVRFGPPPAGRRRTVQVPLTVSIPMRLVSTVERKGRHVAELELRVTAMNDAGERSPVAVVPVRIASDRAPAPGAVETYETLVELRRQDQDVLVSLFDPLSGRLLEAKTRLDL